jgi:hypothetical protein
LAGVAKFKQAFVHPLFKINTDGTHIADDLIAGLLKGEIEASLATPTSGIDKMSGHARFAGAGGAGEPGCCCLGNTPCRRAWYPDVEYR